MEMVIFMGGQGAGKSTYYAARFANSHIRINLDMLKTRHREEILFRACIEMKQPFVVDNTNPLRADRARYIEWARGSRFRVVGYYFESSLDELLARNSARPGKQLVPEVAIRATLKRFEKPGLDEGFDALYRVRMQDDGSLICEGLGNEV